MFGVEATGYSDIETALRQASEDSSVQRIVLKFDSPGGAIRDLHLAVNAVHAARAVKPVVAYVSGICASAAYWIASQAQRIEAAPETEIGGIGVVTSLVDESAAWEKEGLRRIVVSSGPHKGSFIPGAPITEEQLSPLRERIRVHAHSFAVAVADGRNLPISAVEVMADGRTWEPSLAHSLKLIDAISTRDDFFNGSDSNPAGLSPALHGVSAMNDENKNTSVPTAAPAPLAGSPAPSADPQPAPVQTERERLGELRAAFPGDLEFAVQQFELGASLLEAKAAYADLLKIRLDERPAQAITGSEPVPFSTAPVADQGTQDFMAVVEAYAAEKKCTKTEAIQACIKTHADLYQVLLNSN
jgi:signal peptide peptidase SppA